MRRSIRIVYRGVEYVLELGNDPSKEQIIEAISMFLGYNGLTPTTVIMTYEQEWPRKDHEVLNSSVTPVDIDTIATAVGERLYRHYQAQQKKADERLCEYDNAQVDKLVLKNELAHPSGAANLTAGRNIILDPIAPDF